MLMTMLFPTLSRQ